MVLRVDLPKFPEAVRSLLETEEVFLTARGLGSWITAGSPGRDFLLACYANMPVDKVRAELVSNHLKVNAGEWSVQEAAPLMDLAETWVAAVAYISRETMPGLWMDSYAVQPTSAQVLKAMFDEFRENGEIGEVTFEEFVRMANPNVQILSPVQIADFAMQKEGC